MASRYHQNRADRRHESRGMKHYERDEHRSRRGRAQSHADRRREHMGMERYERGPVERRRMGSMTHNPRRSPAERAYRQTGRDRAHESRGMAHWEHMHSESAHHHRGPRDNRDPETELYHKGKRYYGPGYGEPSNMPLRVEQHYYPHNYSSLEADYPDTLREIDEDMHDSFRKVAHYPSDSMY